MKPHEAEYLTPHEARRIAVEACVCERTVRRFVAGLPIRSTCRARIAGALKALGLEALSPDLRESGSSSDSGGALESSGGGAE